MRQVRTSVYHALVTYVGAKLLQFSGVCLPIFVRTVSVQLDSSCFLPAIHIIQAKVNC
jgi:hypothetical protein